MVNELSVTQPILRCEKLVRFLGEEETQVQVLKELSLNLDPQKVYSIVGPSGCGKSTLLYLLGLLDRPDMGKIWISDVDTSVLKAEELNIIRNQYLGFVFQFHFLLSSFTALENVMLPMRKSGKWSVNEMKDRAQYLLKEVGLESKTHRKANQLSGGEQQRVAVARSLSNFPRIVLADEPTGNLDTKNSHLVFDLMKKIAHEKDGPAMLVVTHNPTIAEASDVVLRMEDGQFI